MLLVYAYMLARPTKPFMQGVVKGKNAVSWRMIACSSYEHHFDHLVVRSTLNVSRVGIYPICMFINMKQILIPDVT